MRRRRVGATALELTELGFGGAPIGNLYSAVSDEQAIAAVRAAWDGGIRYFDTAPHYGIGLSERRLGKALQEFPRESFVISTKVGRLLVPNPSPTGTDSDGFDTPDDVVRVLDYSADGVRRSLDDSRQRLGLDRIDIALVHDPDDHLDQAAEESIPALCELRAKGEIGAVGLGMNYVDPLLWFVTRDYPDGVSIDVILVAGRWTLLDRSARRLLDACAERGISVISAAPFNTGLLASPEPPRTGMFNYEPVTDEVLRTAQQFARIAREHGSQLPHAAVRFPLRHPAVASVLAGIRSPQEAGTNCELVADDLDASAWAAIDEVTPVIG
ncbi:aldo/keto reductase [Microlunatus sp. Gsoil 973]|uniref:aldo/keto reductase n=1 Tax=Microlunatus sp. Gsoil 973 TaxID=2672569 RepID=UPI0012B4DC2E|nr:aldo/keto reductase [Microlunatus sp. Gsoil 973]QGN33493.1 aldo/keto reductase [Microlunatus sp. Gsoil 973]